MKNYIVFDLEWNQSPQGKEGTIAHFPFEIIEIGAVKLDQDFQPVSEFHRLIKPQVYQELHYKIFEVVHMDMGELEKEGEDFRTVMRSFLEWCGQEYTFCSWGSMDLTELQRNIAYYGMENPFPSPLLYYDIQKLYSLCMEDGKVKPSLDTAVERLGISVDRPFHRALDDAFYTGRVMECLDWDRIKAYLSVDYYRLPESREDEIYMEFPNYAKYVSHAFSSKEEAIADKNVTSMVCCRCKRMLRKKIRWFSSNQKFYFCLAVCPEHGFVKGKIRMKKSEGGEIFVVKTMKLIDEAGAADIARRKEETRKRRTEKSRMRRQGKKVER